MQPTYGPMPPPRPVLSHDAAWWWDGERWLPVISADGAYRFDGMRWRRVRRLPRWLAISGLIWLVALASWLLVGTVFLAVGPVNGSITELSIIGGLGLVAIVATIAWGALVAWRGETRWLWAAAGVGTAVQLFCYVTAMLAAPTDPGSADNDTAAGAGVVLLAIPTAVIILTLLWLGAALGALTRVVRARRR
jgi:hypothetical protein